MRNKWPNVLYRLADPTIQPIAISQAFNTHPGGDRWLCEARAFYGKHFLPVRANWYWLRSIGGFVWENRQPPTPSPPPQHYYPLKLARATISHYALIDRAMQAEKSVSLITTICIHSHSTGEKLAQRSHCRYYSMHVFTHPPVHRIRDPFRRRKDANNKKRNKMQRDLHFFLVAFFLFMLAFSGTPRITPAASIFFIF